MYIYIQLNRIVNYKLKKINTVYSTKKMKRMQKQYNLYTTVLQAQAQEAMDRLETSFYH